MLQNMRKVRLILVIRANEQGTGAETKPSPWTNLNLALHTYDTSSAIEEIECKEEPYLGEINPLLFLSPEELIETKNDEKSFDIYSSSIYFSTWRSGSLEIGSIIDKQKVQDPLLYVYTVCAWVMYTN